MLAPPDLLGKRTLKRSAKQNVDYTEKGGKQKKRDRKRNSNESDGRSDSDGDDSGRRRFGRLCKEKKLEDESP
jgi:hypothetical protein